MDFGHSNPPFSESPYLYAPQPPPPSQSFNMLPFNPPVMSGFAYQQGHYLAPRGLNSSYPLIPGTAFAYPQFNHMQNMSPALVDPTGQARLLQTPFHFPMPPLPIHPKRSEIVSPVSRRATHSSLHQLLNIDTQPHPKGPSRAPECARTIEKVALPSEMPIGSQVHLRTPPKWGVVKIANIPYSITKQEIIQFLGRQARIISPDKGCAVHIIMERSTAKTMDCYVEFLTTADAQETVSRINRIYETGRAPRLGNRHVDIEVSNQDALLKDLFPRAKCISWRDGIPFAVPNTDPYSTGFAGFFTSEEIVGAIRHAEIPHRSPFCVKCPQRTYESTISTLYKFPWYAAKLYTVHDRNQLFELVNRHIMSLVARVKRSNTIGLDQRLLCDLLYSGLNCPAFNERQKYTLCVNSEDVNEILKFPDMGKWFPFDTLVKMSRFDENTLLYYATLMSKGSIEDHESSELPNTFPTKNFELESPYGRIWYEWPLNTAKDLIWEDAVQHEMVILCNLVLSGWMNNNKIATLNPGNVPEPSSSSNRSSQDKRPVSPDSDKSPTHVETPSRVDTFATPSRRASEQLSYNSPYTSNDDTGWEQTLILRPATRAQGRFLGHRNTLSSPTCLPSSRGY